MGEAGKTVEGLGGTPERKREGREGIMGVGHDGGEEGDAN